MYKVNKDGSIETSSLEEALELSRRIQSQAAKQERQQAKEQQPTLFNGQKPQSAVIKRLMDFVGTQVTSETMKDIVGARTVAGVGPKLHYMRKKDPELDQLLEEQRDARGIVTWTVRQ